jgi:hypothetical protein
LRGYAVLARVWVEVLPQVVGALDADRAPADGVAASASASSAIRSG